MKYMFYKCSSLEELNFSSFNTEKVTNMKKMFSDCILLKKLNLSINTSNVIDMSCMFEGCSLLED